MYGEIEIEGLVLPKGGWTDQSKITQFWILKMHRLGVRSIAGQILIYPRERMRQCELNCGRREDNHESSRVSDASAANVNMGRGAFCRLGLLDYTSVTMYVVD